MNEQDRLDGYCPNCWGSQEYDGKYREVLKDEQIDVNNHQAKRAFIQRFATKYLSGIKLVNRDAKLYCPRCKRTVSSS